MPVDSDRLATGPVTRGGYVLYGLKLTLIAVAVAVTVALLAAVLGLPHLVAVAAVAAGGVAVAAKLRPPGSRGAPVIPSDRRRPGQPFNWALSGRRGLDVEEAVERLRRIGLNPETSEAADVRLSGGSNLRTRLLGGYFVDPARLPVKVELRTQGGAVQAIEVRDALGPVGLRDRALETRYALRVAEIRDALGSVA